MAFMPRARLFSALGACLLALMFLLVVPLDVSAAGAAEEVTAGVAGEAAEEFGPDVYGVVCQDGRCVIRLAVSSEADHPGLTWTVSQQNLHFLPGGGLELLNDVTLASPWGDFRLLDTELRLAVGEGYRLESARGAASIEFPTVGTVALFRSVMPVRAAIGYEPGEQLSHVEIALDPEQPYLYFDLQAGQIPRHLTAGSGIEAAPGQKATLLVDPVNWLLYVDGQLMLYSAGQGALVEQLLEGDLSSFEWSLDVLPLRQVLLVNVRGLANGVDAPFVEAGGQYTADGGMLGEWLRLEGTPLSLGAVIAMNPTGIHIDGEMASSLFPEQLFDVSAVATLFIPLQDSLNDGKVSLALATALPWAGLSGDLDASLTGGLAVGASAGLAIDWGEEPVIYAVAGKTNPQAAWMSMQTGWETAWVSVASGYEVVSEQAINGYGAAEGGFIRTWSTVSEQVAGWRWGGLPGWGEPSHADAPDAVALGGAE